MSRLKELRDELAADLAVLNVPVMDSWLIRPIPPCIFLAPAQGDNYVQAGPNYGLCFVLNVDVIALVEAQPPDEGREDLDTLLEGVLQNTADWSLAGVDPPGRSAMSDSTIEFLGTVVHLGKQFYL